MRRVRMQAEETALIWFFMLSLLSRMMPRFWLWSVGWRCKLNHCNNNVQFARESWISRGRNMFSSPSRKS